MKTITLTEFEELIERDDWQHDVEFKVEETHERNLDIELESGARSQLTMIRAYGDASVTSTCEDVTIRFNISFRYNLHTPHEFTTSSDPSDEDEFFGPWEGWELEGLIIVDDETGKELSEIDVLDILYDNVTMPSKFRIDEDNYTKLDLKYGDSVDPDEDPDAKSTGVEDFDEEVTHHYLIVDHAPDLSITGQRIAYATNKNDWNVGAEFSIYKTKLGKIVCHRTYKRACSSEYECFAEVYDSLDDVKRSFGDSDLAKELYECLPVKYWLPDDEGEDQPAPS